MDENLIRKYAVLMRELELSALEINTNGESVRLERSTAPAAVVSAAAAPAYVPGATLQQPPAVPATPPAPSTIEVTSPMIGVFYTSPAEDAEPFVKPGSVVKRGDVLCIIEAMKLMNEITAETDGVITEVCVENGQTVDFGRVLFRMKETGR
jgi:acetyl-CoA carboxylase biotin carboxyl carrier protein